MNPEYISLSKFCKNRFPKLPKHSQSDETFKVQDFQSPDFINRITDHSNIQDITNELSAEDLKSLVEEVNQTFEVIEHELRIFKDRLIQKILTFCTSNDRSHELSLLKKEIQVCHRALRDKVTDPILVEEFSWLLDKYKKVAHSKNPQTILLKTTTEKLHETLASFRSAIKACEESNNMNSYKPFIIKHELGDFQVSSKLDISTVQEATYPFNTRAGFKTVNHIFDHKGQQHLLNLSSELTGTMRYEIINLDNKKIVESSIFYERFVPSHGTKICYSKALECLITTGDKTKVNFYRLTSRGLRKVTSIILKFTSVEQPRFGFAFEEAFISVLDNHYALAAVLKNKLNFVNVFTKRVISEHMRPSPVHDIKYIESSNLFVIINSNKTVDIYEVMNRAETLRIRHHLILEIDNKIGSVSLEDNMISIPNLVSPYSVEIIEATYEEAKRSLVRIDPTFNGRIVVLRQHRAIFVDNLTMLMSHGRLHAAGGDRVILLIDRSLVSRKFT